MMQIDNLGEMLSKTVEGMSLEDGLKKLALAGLHYTQWKAGEEPVAVGKNELIDVMAKNWIAIMQTIRLLSEDKSDARAILADYIEYELEEQLDMHRSVYEKQEDD